MTALVGLIVCVALAPAAYFLLLLADGRRLRGKMPGRRSPSLSEETGPLPFRAESEYPLWAAPRIAGPQAHRTATPPRPHWSQR